MVSGILGLKSTVEDLSFDGLNLMKKKTRKRSRKVKAFPKHSSNRPTQSVKIKIAQTSNEHKTLVHKMRIH